MGYLLSVEQRNFILEKFISTGKKARPTVAAFCERFPEAPVPAESTPARIFARFKKTGSVGPLPRKKKKRTVLTKRKLGEVRRALDADKKLPPTERRQTGNRNTVGLKRTSFRKATKLLKKRPYKLKRRPRGRIIGAEYPSRLEFCHFIARQPPEFFEKYICTDEKTFSLDEHINRGNHFQYCDAWKGGDDNFFVGVSNHGGSVSVWGAVTGAGDIYIDFIPQGARVDGVLYKKIVTKYCRHLAAQVGVHAASLKNKGFIFQQDGATPHTVAPVLKYLSTKFSLVVSRRPKKHENLDLGTTVMVNWPSHSPDLSTCDHYLWNRLKELVYEHPTPNTVEELKAKIKASVPRIPKEEVIRGVFATKKWAAKCIEKNGAHID